MYRVEHEDQYGNIVQYDRFFIDENQALAFAERMWNIRQDYARVSVIDTKTEEVVCDYEH